MKLTREEVEKLTNKQLTDLFWYGDRLEREEADLIEDEILNRGLDVRPGGDQLYKLFVPES